MKIKLKCFAELELNFILLINFFFHFLHKCAYRWIYSEAVPHFSLIETGKMIIRVVFINRGAKKTGKKLLSCWRMLIIFGYVWWTVPAGNSPNQRLSWAWPTSIFDEVNPHRPLILCCLSLGSAKTLIRQHLYSLINICAEHECHEVQFFLVELIYQGTQWLSNLYAFHTNYIVLALRLLNR